MLVELRLKNGQKLLVSKTSFDNQRTKKGLLWLGKKAIHYRDIIGHEYIKERSDNGK